MKVSFDFDSTLSTNKIKGLLSIFDRTRVQVYIITSRSADLAHGNVDLWKVAYDFGIPTDMVHLTNGMPKSEVCKQLEIDIHFDDMPEEIAHIQATCPKTLGVLVSTNIFGDMHYLNSFFPEPLKSIQQYESEFE